MNIHKINPFLIALSNESLKAKYLSGDDFFSIICIKKKATEHITKIIEAETEFANANNAKVVDRNYVIYDDKGIKDEAATEEFSKKIKDIQKDFEPEKINFIKKEDFKKWIDEIQMEQAALLYEYLCEL